MSNKGIKDANDAIKSWEIGQVFDEMSDKYTDIMDHMVPHYRKLIASMLECLPAGFKPLRILDLGCGNGNVSAVSMALFPGAHHHLVDASEEMIGLCKTRFEGRSISYEHNLFQNLEYIPGTYDLVLAGFSLHHLDAGGKRKFFTELFPGLTEIGVLACADLFINKESEEHRHLLNDWNSFAFASGKTQEDWDWVMDHYDAYDRPSAFNDQQKWLTKAGFVHVELSWNAGHWGCFHAYKN